MVGVRVSCRATSFRSMSGMCAYVAWWLAPCLETTGNGRAAATCDFACQLKRCNYTAHILGVLEFSRTPSTHMNSLGVCVSASLRMWLVGGQSHLCLHRGRSPVASKHQLLPGGNHICTCTRGASPNSGCCDTSCDAASRGDGDCKALKWRAARGGPCNLPDHLDAGWHGSALTFGCLNHIE